MMHAAPIFNHEGEAIAAVSIAGPSSRFDAEVIEQMTLGFHHVPDGDDRELQAVGASAGRVDGGRPGGTHAAAEHIGTNHEQAVGVEGLAWPDAVVPPADAAIRRVQATGRMRVAAQGMQHQDGVRARGVERAIRLIGQGNWP